MRLLDTSCLDLDLHNFLRVMSSSVQAQCVSGVEEWRELESDPGVFSLLIEDYGVRGVKVEEVYDITTNFDCQVYGFVFLFRYELSDRRARKKARELVSMSDCYVLDSNVVNQMFFAHQIINNSCATHALLSVLLNCNDLNIGPNLTKLKEFSRGLDPESKGYAIANMMELAHIHNKHARPPSNIIPPVGGRKASVVSSAYALLPETYHFVSFVPINGRLFELDGLKEYPIDHGPWGEQEKWTDLFLRTVSLRLAQSQDFLFNLMALIPDPVPQISEHLKTLLSEQNSLLEVAIKFAKEISQNKETEQKVSRDTPTCTNGDTPAESVPSLNAKETHESNLSEVSIKEPKEESGDNEKIIQNTDDSCTLMDVHEPSANGLESILSNISRSLPTDSVELDALIATPLTDTQPATLDRKLCIAVAKVVKNHKEIETQKQKLKEEIETKQRFRVEHSRRIHDYDPFVFEFVKCLAHNKQLPDRLLRRPSIAQPVRGGGGGSVRQRRKGGRATFKGNRPKTTLLLNGAQVS